VRLSGDVELRVRNAVAGNGNTPAEVVEILEKADDEFSNNMELVTNPETHTAIPCRFINDSSLSIRQSLAAHLNTSPSVLDYLIRDDAVSVLVQVALNPNTSESALEYLNDDVDSEVQNAAASNLNA
jgi:hypothetical protein